MLVLAGFSLAACVEGSDVEMPGPEADPARSLTEVPDPPGGSHPAASPPDTRLHGDEAAPGGSDGSPSNDLRGDSEPEVHGPATAEASAWEREGRRPELVLVRELGSLEGEDAFASVRDVAPGPDGTLYVLDRTARLVSVWDTAGRRLLEFGGRGGGPGEFRNPTYLRVLADGRVAVGEMLPARIHWFTREGEFLGSGELKPPPDAPRISAFLSEWRVTPDGRARVRVATISPQLGDSTPHALLAVDEDGTVRDTLVKWRQAGTPANLPRLFEPRWTWDLGPDGSILLTPGGEYEVRIHAPDGGLRTVLRHETEGVPVTPELREAALEELVRDLQADGLSPQMIRSLKERVEVAPALPATEGLWASESDGRLWVGIPLPAEDGERVEVGAWDVFTSGGERLGRVPTPPSFRLLTVRGDHLYGVWKDELDVGYVRVYRLAGVD